MSIFVGFSDLMEAQLDRLRYEVFQNLFYSPMDAGILRAAVATAPTVYGIETKMTNETIICFFYVATAPTVYGIETKQCCNSKEFNS